MPFRQRALAIRWWSSFLLFLRTKPTSVTPTGNKSRNPRLLLLRRLPTEGRLLCRGYFCKLGGFLRLLPRRLHPSRVTPYFPLLLSSWIFLNSCHRLYCSAFAGSESSYPCIQNRNQSTDNPCDAIRSAGLVITCSSLFIKVSSTGLCK